MKDAKGHGSNARAEAAGAYEGKPVFHGYTASGNRVNNASGNPIAYASAEAAVAGAKFTQDQHAANELSRGSQKSGAVPVHAGTGGSDSFFGRSASGAAAAHKEAQDFQATRATSGPHYLGANSRPQSGSMRGGIKSMRANSQRRADRKGKGYSL